MSTVMTPTRGVSPQAGAPVATVLSRQLMVAGLLGGHVAAIACVIGAGMAAGRSGLASAMVAAVVVIAFFAIGQGIVARQATSQGSTLLVAALVSYVVRVVGLGALLATYHAMGAQLGLNAHVMSLTIIVTVLGWLTAEIWRFRTLRIPTFDSAAEDAGE